MMAATHRMNAKASEKSFTVIPHSQSVKNAFFSQEYAQIQVFFHHLKNDEILQDLAKSLRSEVDLQGKHD